MSRTRRGCLATLVAVLILTAAVSAQQRTDPLEQYKERMAVAVQKVETEVREAVTEAQKLLPTNPAAAAEKLRKALTVVEEDKFLSDTRRLALRRDLKDRILLADATAARKADREVTNGLKSGAAARQAEQDQDADRVAALLTNIRELQRQGRLAEANRLADEVARRYPSNPAATAAGRTGSMAERVAESRELINEKERRMTLAMREIEKSALPPIDDIEFPRDWREKTKMRAKNNQLTKAERAILEALDSPITIDIKDAKFEDVIDFLEKKTGQSIIMDKPGLDSATVGYDTPVTVRARNVATKTVLRKVLSELGLAFVVKDETIYVTSAERARGMLTTRTYYMGDLLGVVDARWGPWVSNAQVYSNVVQLMTMITQSVEPDGWQVNERGGFATITFHPPTMSFVVKGSAEVHYSMRSSFR
jgi:hypothetical protein